MRLLSVLVAAAALVAACGASPSSAPSTSTATAGPITEPSIVGLACGEYGPFDPAILDVPGTAETNADAGAAALRAFLASPDGAGQPQAGWSRVLQAAGSVVFLAPTAGGEFALLTVRLDDGAWFVEDVGRCTPQVALPAGLGLASWRLDPATPARPEATSLAILITEQACTGGRSPEGRVREPVVRETAASVLVTVVVASLPGAHDCQGNPEFRLQVPLDQVLGERRLFDGAVYPAAEVAPDGILE